MSTEPRPGAVLAAGISKEDAHPWSLSLGVEVRLAPSFSIRTGAGTLPERIGMGAALAIGTLEVDIVAERHVELGWTPGVGLSVLW
jgi:hypothetical protein